MGEKQMEQKFNELLGNLTGPSKWIAAKILNSSFAEEARNVLNSSNSGKVNWALNKLIEKATQKAASAIRLKVAIVLTIAMCIPAVLAIMLISNAAGDSIMLMLPIAALITIVAVIWFATGIMSKLAARKISGIIFKTIEGKAAQFIA